MSEAGAAGPVARGAVRLRPRDVLADFRGTGTCELRPPRRDAILAPGQARAVRSTPGFPSPNHDFRSESMKKVRIRIAALVPVALMVIGWGCSGTPAVSTSTTEATVKGTVTIQGKPATKGTVEFDPANYQRKDVQARS